MNRIPLNNSDFDMTVWYINSYRIIVSDKAFDKWFVFYHTTTIHNIVLRCTYATVLLISKAAFEFQIAFSVIIEIVLADARPGDGGAMVLSPLHVLSLFFFDHQSRCDATFLLLSASLINFRWQLLLINNHFAVMRGKAVIRKRLRSQIKCGSNCREHITKLV